MSPETEGRSSTTTGLGRDFWLFRLGQAISIVGDSCNAIALAWWILDATGSAAAMSAVLAPAMLVRIVLAPMFGPSGDRFARKTLIVVSDLWRGGLTLFLAMMAYQGRFSLPAVIGLYVLTAIGSALYGPVSTSIVPQLVTSENLTRAFQQSQAIASAGAILGGVIGGALVSLLGVPGAFAIDATSFLIGAATAQLVRADTRPAGVARAVPSDLARESAVARWMLDLTRGFRFLYAVRLLFALALVAMLVNFVLAPLFVVLPVLVKEGRGLPPWYLVLLCQIDESPRGFASDHF
jgi:DHA3 family macrolide efflux protein-like MFS transporter